ncbi:sn-glycerol-3-phosphate ABC transporter ATP-binding protein [Advenella kashmirensis W13003]|uniref:sn-glycerol-3-phosphate ABC transporter ATP-binding protein n=1 Tax=Advenella kashmirensis W13003 TaxID=1424334 RepID=V8QPK8_9BURK|nr:sn-glycerol-3-phosphate import ATP-binding protein UgpC [Advenella kashmirensis]ETF01901.1 sn-glycerol-3-phosphate ABC transporter ATP-binding protein [Advenella kashmirensis W13003]
MATLQLNDIRKTYPGNVAVIHGVDIDVQDGEFIVIVGPSGCGKSTLMRMVAGLETVTAGQILIDGAVVNELEPAERDIAMVFQNYALYPHMSVYENMAYGLKIRKLTKEQINERVQQAAAILELSQLLQRRPKQLSGGQRQRVAMGRAIVRDPKVFLFDEPLSNLDAKLRVQMRLEIQKLHRRLRTTSLYVTHDQVEAMTLADRMVVMNKGVAEQIGTPIEVFEKPATTFVAAFIGSPPMNLIPVSVTAEGLIKTMDGQQMSIPAGQIPERARGKNIILGFRPEHVTLNQPGIPLVIEMIEILGSEKLIHARVGETLVVIRCDVHDAGSTHYTLGDTIDVGPDTRHPLHWFDPETTRRID